MYPNDNRYPESMPNMDSMPPMYGNQMRTSSIDMSSNRPYYEAPSYYDKMPPMMQQPIYDYGMSQPPMMPMNQGIDPRYPVWRQSSENRASMMPSYYDRPPEPYMHPKAPVSMPYPDQYPPAYNPVPQIKPSQMNLLQRISYLIKPQLSDLKKIMSKAATSSTSYKKKQYSRRQRSYERQRPRQRSRSHERKKPSNSSGGQWICPKCSFLNFDWRDKCKKCTESKPSLLSSSSGGGRNFIPGPEDWKCYKCGNLNYARRVECNRCKLPKSANK